MSSRQGDNALPEIRRSDFAADFRWGCATSAYQIEGAATADGRGESIWDRFCATPGKVRNGDSGAVACDHYRRWPEDLDSARDLGLNAYRFSIAWPRIFPQGRGAKPNEKGLDFYSRLVDGMLERGLQPWATLYHWDLPQALQQRGGWAKRDVVAAFADFADAVSRHLGDRVKHWMTHNEPWCTAFLGHYEGVHAPGQKNLATALQVCHHVLVSHGAATAVIRRNVAGARVGIALSLHPATAASTSLEDAMATKAHDGLRNRWFLDPLFGRGYPADVWHLLGDNVPTVLEGDLALIAAPTDFLGVNYYFPETVRAAAGDALLGSEVVAVPGVERTDFGWEVSPQGLVTLLDQVNGDYRPAAIYITENGSRYDDVVNDAGVIDDRRRLSYLLRHIAAVRQSVAGGVPVKGYFAWSLLDNFEWAEGYRRRFGLIHVDFATQERRLKRSGEWYRAFLRGEG